jgi:hypothetical protein
LRELALREGIFPMIALESFLTAANCLGELSRLRAETLRDMTADLAETGNFRDRGDAVRQLHADGYRTIDVMILVDEAIYLCKQDVIAREMTS